MLGLLWQQQSTRRGGSPGEAPTNVQLSNDTIWDDALVGDLVGTLSADGASGYQLVGNPNGLFQLDAPDLEVGSLLFPGTYNVNVQAIGSGKNTTVNFPITIQERPKPSYLGHGTVFATTSVTSGSVPLPAGMQANDIIVIIGVCLNTNTAFTVPAGYTEITQFAVGAHQVGYFWKRHSGSESNPTLENTGRTGTNLLSGQAFAIRGCKTSGTPFEAMTSRAGASSALLGQSVACGGWKRLAVNVYAVCGNNTGRTVGAGWTERLDQGTGGGGACRYLVASRDVEWPGTFEAPTFGASGLNFGVIGLAFIGVAAEAVLPVKRVRRGMWVWDTMSLVLGSLNEQYILLNECINSGITDLYIYAPVEAFPTYTEVFENFIGLCTQLSVRCWAMDGYRELLDDADGPQNVYDLIDIIKAYNAATTADKRFMGFHLDLEPADSGDYTSFHNGIAQSALSTTPGSGVWQDTQALDREMLMRSWISIHQELKTRCTAAGLEFGSALPTWCDDYFGEPVTCTFNGVEQNVYLHLAPLIDNISIMSYNTTPANVIDRVSYEYYHAPRVVPHPAVGFSIESHVGVGSGVSYGDTPGKQSKAAALADIETVSLAIGQNPRHLYVNFHDWEGWKALAPASNNTALPAIRDILTVGDSLTQFGNFADNTSRLENQMDSMIGWARALTGARFRHWIWHDSTATDGAAAPLFRGANYGIAGDIPSGVAARMAPLINSPTGVRGLVYCCGTNTAPPDDDPEVSFASIEQAVDAWMASADGRWCILCTIPARTVSETPTGLEINPARWAEIAQINEDIRAKVAADTTGLLFLADLEAATIDPDAPIAGNPLPGVVRDGVHLAPYGAYLCGVAIAGAIEQAMAPGQYFEPDPAVNNLMANDLMTGSQAINSNSCSGNIPGSPFSVLNTAGAGQPLTAVCSLEANSETGGQTWVIDLANSSAGTGIQTIRCSSGSLNLGTLGLTAGTYVQMIAELEVTSPALIGSLQLTLSNGTYTSKGMGFTNSNRDTEPFPAFAEPTTLWIETEPMDVMMGNPSATTLTPRIDIDCRRSQVDTARVKIKRWIIRTVQDPHVVFPYNE